LYLSSIETQAGIIKLVFHPQKGISRVYLPGGGGPEAALESGRLPWTSLPTDLARYFNGEKITFDYPLDLTAYTLFQLKIISIVSRIYYGRTLSYGEVAAGAGSPHACRAVGGVMAANLHPLLIPCHRVIRSDGSIGGYSAGRGWKKILLALESGNIREYRNLLKEYIPGSGY
jgi:methylated-DNA-[protein]-cysteine S-methyltransferase